MHLYHAFTHLVRACCSHRLTLRGLPDTGTQFDSTLWNISLLLKHNQTVTAPNPKAQGRSSIIPMSVM